MSRLLPLSVVEALIAPLKVEAERQRAEAERQRAQRQYRPIDRNSDAAARKVQRLLDHAYHQLAGVTSDRTGSAFGQARRLARHLACWPISEADIERTLLDALRSNGAADKYGDGELLRHIRNGIRAGLSDTPEPLEMPTRSPQAHVSRRATRASAAPGG